MPRPSAKRHKDSQIDAVHRSLRTPLDVSLRGAKRRGNLGKAVAARTSHRRPHALPNLTVAAFPAQPLAALPPYGCGVPLADCERPAGWQYLRHKFIGAMPSSLSLRGGRRPTWQSRSTRPDHRKAIGENATAFPRLPRRFAPRNDTSGGYCGAPAPSSGLIPLCKALNERRYRRNRSVRFYRHLVRTGSAFPRLPRPLWGLAMTRQGSAAMGTVRRTASAVLLPLRGRAGHAPPLQGQYGLNGGWYKSAVPSRDCHGPFGASQ